MKLTAVLFLLLSGVMLSAAPLNVKDFGAVGDGITDDTAAIQRAFDAVDAHSKANREVYGNDYGRITGWGVFDGPNQELFFPAGEYRITGTIVGGHAFTLTGEEGSVIFTEDEDLLMFYLWPAYRISLRDLTFKGGRTHIFFSTNNMDVMSFVAENCRFENSSYFALDSGNYRQNNTPIGPWSVKRDENGLAVLTENTFTSTNPNSTKYILTGCEFTNCAGASGVRTDGPFISNCTFISDRPQQLPVFKGTWTGSIYNCFIQANIPDDYDTGIIDGMGKVANITFISSSEYGAPLLRYYKDLSYLSPYGHPDGVVIENCISSSANSKYDAILYLPDGRPVQLTFRNNHESAGNMVQAIYFGNIPVDEQDLMKDQHHHSNPNIVRTTVADSHGILIDGNGEEVDTSLPDILYQFLKKDIPAEYTAAFPDWKAVIEPADLSKCQVLDAADFGIGHEDSPEDIANLQKLFDEAAKTENPLICLPGRKFIVSEPLIIPQKCVIRADGRTVFHAAKDTNGIFKVSGDDIEIEIIGLLFNGGTNSIEITGAGTARFNDCIFYDNRTAILNRQTGEEKLLTEVFASSAYSPVFVENYDGEFHIIDGWISMQGTLDYGACLRNFGNGTMVCANVCGVPVLFGAWLGRPDWPYINDVFWFENHGTLRTTAFRFGAEGDGACGVDNYGNGRVLVEGGSCMAFWSQKGPRVFLRNESSEAEFAIGTIASYGAISPKKSAFCEGELPGVFFVGNYNHTDYLTLRSGNGTVSAIKY